MCGVWMDDKGKYILSQALDIDINNIPQLDNFSFTKPGLQIWSTKR